MLTESCCTAMVNGVFKPMAMSIPVGVKGLHRHWQEQQHLGSLRMISIFNLGMERPGYAHPLTPSTDMTQMCCAAMANGIFKPRSMLIPAGVKYLHRHW